MTTDARRQLAIYLNDHLAGSTGAVELIRRAVGEYEGTELGTFFAGIGAEIDEDRDSLKAIMAENGIGSDSIKIAAAWAAEKVGRLKFNGALLRRSPLTPLIELETLAVGITGKLALWRGLREQPADAQAEARLDELIARAERQLATVEPRRLEAARQALTPARAR